MGTIYQRLDVENAQFLGTAFPDYVKVLGSNFPVAALGYDQTTVESAYWKFRALAYGSGNITVDIDWYANNVNTGAVVWGAAVAAMTPNVDDASVEAKAFATQNTATGTLPGSDTRRPNRTSITISNLDSIAVDDIVWIRIQRVANDGSDTMAADARLLQVTLSYSDS